MKRAISIVTVVLATVVASGCCGGLETMLHHPLGPNTICEPVHRAHYDNGFEVGYGSECESCGLGPAGPACSCHQYGADASAGCLTCALSGENNVPVQSNQVARSTKATRLAKTDHGVKQVSYETTEGCTECVESDPCCGGCGKADCCCCAPRCPDVCETCCHPGPLAWLFTILHPEKYYGGCGEVYLGDFHSYPPDCTDPCNRCGHWTGESNCNAWTGCNVCGQCEASYGEPCQECQSCSSGVSEPEMVQGSTEVQGPILISQTDRVVQPAESRTASTKRSTSTVKRR